MITLDVEVPDSLHEHVIALAAREGISIDHFVASAVAEKMSALMTDDDLGERARRGSRAAYDAVLARVPDAEPDERDRL